MLTTFRSLSAIGLLLFVVKCVSSSNREQSLFQMEKQLALREVERMDLLSRQQLKGYEVKGFYHTSSWQPYWADVISEQLWLLDGARKFPPKNTNNNQTDYIRYRWDFEHDYFSLLNISTSLYFNVALHHDNVNLTDLQQIKMLVDSLNLRFRHKVVFGYNLTISRKEYWEAKKNHRNRLDSDPRLSAGEHSTITLLKDYCDHMTRRKKKAIVYYFHAKGGCCKKNFWNESSKSPVATWREYMNAMNLEFPSICLRALLQRKYSACGVDNHDRHFSGNYWWADCQHVSRLHHLRDRWDYRESEMFILNPHVNVNVSTAFGHRCGYSIYDCGVNLYNSECPRWKYRDRLNRYVHHRLGPNHLRYKYQDDNTELCVNLKSRGKSYVEMKDELEKYFPPDNFIEG